jgi:iron complex transport system permease protein
VRKKSRIAVLVVVLAIVLCVSVIWTISIGPVKIPPETVYMILRKQLLSGDALVSELWSKAQFHIVWDIRVPRVLMGMLTGAGLAMCGAVMQALVLNPIADPFILGVSSGASAGAALALLTPVAWFGGTGQVTIMAFLGAIAASVLVYTMSLIGSGTRLQAVAVLLSGTAVNAIMTAVTNFLIFLAKSPESIATVYYWQMGSLASAQWQTLFLPMRAVIVGAVIFMLCGTRFNLLMMGDEDAIALGVRVHRFRTLMMLVVALVVASLVSVVGVIGFVGLMIPHLVRMLIGASDNRIVIPVCVLMGALYIIWADAGARGLFESVEVPLGIITAFIGAPFFVSLLLRQRLIGKGGGA